MLSLKMTLQIIYKLPKPIELCMGVQVTACMKHTVGNDRI